MEVTTLLLVMLVIAVIGYRILQNRRTAPTRCPPGMVPAGNARLGSRENADQANALGGW